MREVGNKASSIYPVDAAEVLVLIVLVSIVEMVHIWHDHRGSA